MESTVERSDDITRLLADLKSGDRAAAEALFPRVYQELRRLAGAYFRNQDAGHTLQPTALVHEAYVKLADASGVSPSDRQHFFMLAARVMRQILVDHARARGAAKRRQPAEPRTLIDIATDPSADQVDVLALETALEKLARLDEPKARLVELRFFGGLTGQEAADVLGISRTQAARWWRMVKAWLASELDGGAAS
jgi:RNA polymerase sigma-70 factor (ECF subfamily)